MGASQQLLLPNRRVFYSEVAADSPIHWWKMDETSGTTATDSGSTARNGTYNNGAVVNQTPICMQGRSVDFDGTNDFLQLASSTFTDLNGVSSYGVEGFFNVDAFGTDVSGDAHSIISGDLASNIAFLSLNVGSVHVYGTFRSINGDSAQTISWVHGYSTGQNHVLALNVDIANDSVELFSDGVSVLTQGVTFGNATLSVANDTVRYVAAGRNGSNVKPSRFWDGRIQSVSLYSTKLTADRWMAHKIASGI